nr:MAG TPA: hypothetical protein [Caudoviricetes sp.]
MRNNLATILPFSNRLLYCVYRYYILLFQTCQAFLGVFSEDLQ